MQKRSVFLVVRVCVCCCFLWIERELIINTNVNLWKYNYLLRAVFSLGRRRNYRWQRKLICAHEKCWGCMRSGELACLWFWLGADFCARANRKSCVDGYHICWVFAADAWPEKVVNLLLGARVMCGYCNWWCGWDEWDFWSLVGFWSIVRLINGGFICICQQIVISFVGLATQCFCIEFQSRLHTKNGICIIYQIVSIRKLTIKIIYLHKNL